MEEEIMICFICGREIHPNSNFMEITEFDNDKVLQVKHSHKSCWDIFIDDRKSKVALKKMTLGLAGQAQQLINKAKQAF